MLHFDGQFNVLLNVKVPELALDFSHGVLIILLLIPWLELLFILLVVIDLLEFVVD